MSDKYNLDWNVPPFMAMAHMGSCFSQFLHNIVMEQMPELSDLFPMMSGYHSETHITEGWILFTMVSEKRVGRPTPSGQDMTLGSAEQIMKAIGDFRIFTYNEIKTLLGQRWCNFDTFTYVGPYKSGFASQAHASQHFVEWLNDCVIAEVYRRNEMRIRRGLPDFPDIDPNKLLQSIWVLECEEECKQGTAFYINGVGMVTCSHVIGSKTHAFHPNDVTKKYPIKIIKRNQDIDLAVVELDLVINSNLSKGSADNLKQMDPLFVLGYPNYRLGDKGLAIPGVVIGFRTVSGIRRILTNSAIVQGNSGGPVIDRHERVVGVVVTGADSWGNTQNTENNGIIPIDALQHILK